MVLVFLTKAEYDIILEIPWGLGLCEWFFCRVFLFVCFSFGLPFIDVKVVVVKKQQMNSVSTNSDDIVQTIYWCQGSQQNSEHSEGRVL